MTVALFVEAVDTIRALGWALAVWIVLLAVVAGVVLYAVVVTVAWPCNAARDALTAALAASRAARTLPEHQDAHEAAYAHTAPSWARTETEEAA